MLARKLPSTAAQVYYLLIVRGMQLWHRPLRDPVAARERYLCAI